jgi:hypothetical protein
MTYMLGREQYIVVPIPAAATAASCSPSGWPTSGNLFDVPAPNVEIVATFLDSELRIGIKAA